MKLGLPFLIVLVLVELAVSSCPNNCNDHGVCTDDSCQCYPNYAGVDCSIVDFDLTSTQTVNDDVPKYEWHFYHVDFKSSDTSVLVNVTQTSIGDCDVYAKFMDYPTKTTYDYRDIGEDSNQIWTVSPDGSAGSYYVGLYGFLHCQATVTIYHSDSSCPNECSGHGTCSSGHCVCTDGFVGDDCSTRGIELHEDAPILGHVEYRSGMYYSIPVTSSHNELVVVYNGTDESQDICSTFIAYGYYPNKTHFDIRLDSESQNYITPLGRPKFGVYYVWVYANHKQVCDYYVSYRFSEGCTCSAHGSCSSNGACHCQDEFRGDSCEEMIPSLSWNKAVTGHVAPDAWNYYHIVSETESNIIVNLEQESSEHDCDVYVLAGSNPTMTDYDYRDISVAQAFNVTIQEPGDLTWYIGVHGFLGECAYQIKAFLDADTCPDGCDLHGTCTNGYCACDSGYAGDSCSFELTTASSGDEFSDTLKSNEWHYYQVDGVKEHLYAYLHEQDSSGAMNIFASEQLFPTERHFEFRGLYPSKNSHRIEIHRTKDDPETTYIFGVFIKDVDVADDYTYNLSFWAPDL